MDFRAGEHFAFDEAARFVARVVEELQRTPMPEGTLLNVNCPAGDASGVEVARLGKRIYRDELELQGERDGKHVYWIYGAPDWVQEDGTDLAAVAAGRIAVTPLHLDVTDRAGLDALERRDLARLLAPAAEEVE
jgi:5'-nucleotidase